MKNVKESVLSREDSISLVFHGRRKMHLWMMCLGKDWDPQKKLDGETQHHDNIVPPIIPAEFIPFVYRAIHRAHEALIINLG